MRLRLWDYIEAKVVGKARPPATSRLAITRAEPFPEEQVPHKVIVDYRFQAGARCQVDDTPEAIRWGKDRVVQMLARELHGDLHSELLDLREHALEAGWGQEADARIERLVRLVSGEKVT